MNTSISVDPFVAGLEVCDRSALPEPCVNLSIHTAPDVHPADVAVDWICRNCEAPPVAGWPRHHDWTMDPLRSGPITGPSSLLRSPPPLCSSSVLWPLRI